MSERETVPIWRLPASELRHFPDRERGPAGAAAWAGRLLDATPPPLSDDVLPAILLVCSAPTATAVRAGVAIALACHLRDRGKRIVLLDGDDQRPDLSAWLDRTEQEGWIDVVRYGISPRRAGATLSATGDGNGIILLGVGSYQPVRLTQEEAASLAERLTGTFDHVLIAVPGSDLAAPWLELDGAGLVMCRGDGALPSGWLQDGSPLLEVVTTPTVGASFEPVTDEKAAGTREQSRRHRAAPRPASSAVFKRLAVLLAVLFFVSAVWWLGILREQQQESVRHTVTIPATDTLQDTTAGGVANPPADDAAADTVSVGPQAPGGVAEAASAGGDLAVTADTTVRRDPLAMPVGGQGYALHISSLTDSNGALRELQELQQRTSVRGLIRREWHKGRWWYRIYVGSFPTLAAARSAIDSVKHRLGVDYAMPVNLRRLQQ